MTKESKERKLSLARELSYDIRRTITDFLSENVEEESITKADWLLISTSQSKRYGTDTINS